MGRFKGAEKHRVGKIANPGCEVDELQSRDTCEPASVMCDKVFA